MKSVRKVSKMVGDGQNKEEAACVMKTDRDYRNAP